MILAFTLTAMLFLQTQPATVPSQGRDPDFDATVAKPAYVDRHPSVVIDEAHNNFHTAGGRYRPFADLLRNDGYLVKPGIAPLTEKVLAGHDVYIIANARASLTEDECAVLRKWIENGGALLLIADHAPFGTHAKNLAQALGVDMSCGFTGDEKHSVGNPGTLVFSKANGLLTPHAITEGLDSVTTFPSQSVKGPEGSIALLKLSDSAFDVDQPREDAERKPAAGRAQSIAFTLGQGRVVVMGEAACLTAQVVTAPNGEVRK